MSLKIKLKKFTASSGNPTTSDLENGEVGINPVQQKVFVNNSGSIVELGSAGGSSIDLSAVDSDIVPDANNTRSLGSASKRWADLFLSGSTINLGGSTISSDGTGTVTISSTGVTLPEGSKDANGNKLAVADSITGNPIRRVPLFTAAGGLGTAATNFNFRASKERQLTFSAFTNADGSAISTVIGTTIFEF